MMFLKNQALRIVVASAGIAIIAGCSSTAAGPTTSGSSIPNVSRVQPATSVSTVIGIKNDWISTISGTGSAQCWNISPGLPNVGGFGQLSGKITLTYTPLCPSPGGLQITYGPEGTSTSADCTFNVNYNGSAFTYSVIQGSGTNCSVGPSPTTGYDEILTYAQIGPDVKRSNR
jgi:hypothetical protein